MKLNRFLNVPRVYLKEGKPYLVKKPFEKYVSLK